MRNGLFNEELSVKALGERSITLLSLHPNLAPEERTKQKNQMEQGLFDVFSRYEQPERAPSPRQSKRTPP